MTQQTFTAEERAYAEELHSATGYCWNCCEDMPCIGRRTLDALDAAEAKAAQLSALVGVLGAALKAVEWIQGIVSGDDLCNACECYRDEGGHAPDCIVGNAIA